LLSPAVQLREELGLSDQRYFGDPVPAAEITEALKQSAAD
jgi:hypothetical protein